MRFYKKFTKRIIQFCAIACAIGVGICSVASLAGVFSAMRMMTAALAL